MNLNNRRFWLNNEEWSLEKKGEKASDPALSSLLSKIFLLELSVGKGNARLFHDGDSDDALLDRVSLKPLKKRKVEV